MHHFVCPASTVFDYTLSVCNFPWAAPPCETATVTEEEEEVVGEEGGDDTSSTQVVVVAPTFAFQCTSPGLFAHESDCSRFWLCRSVLIRFDNGK